MGPGLRSNLELGSLPSQSSVERSQERSRRKNCRACDPSMASTISHSVVINLERWSQGIHSDLQYPGMIDGIQLPSQFFMPLSCHALSLFRDLPWVQAELAFLPRFFWNVLYDTNLSYSWPRTVQYRGKALLIRSSLRRKDNNRELGKRIPM